jgi:uncharacterized protein
MTWSFWKSRPAKPQIALVRNQTRNNVLAESTEIADDSATRRKGLLGRNSLPPGHGIWIVPCSAVHSWGMKFAIDLLYLDRKQRVRKVRHGMAPWSLSMCLLADSVLELPAGTAAQTKTQPGDQLDFKVIE